MKKILFLTLALAVGMTGFAQSKNQPVKAGNEKIGTANIYKKAYKGINETPCLEFTHTTSAPMVSSGVKDAAFPVDVQTMMTHYDLQSNGFVANRMHRFEDGTVGLVATWSQLANLSDRGTGYDYYNGSEFLFNEDSNPLTARVEVEKTGWPCYTQYGPDGEIVISHAAFGTNNCHLTYYTREKKGEGEWQGPFNIPNPDNLGTTVNLMSWPKIATSGENHDIIHVLGADQDDDNLADSYLFYSRSTDGENWTTTFVPTLEDWEHTIYGSDYYALAANGNYVAILLTGEVLGHTYVIKSCDNGVTWEKIMVWYNPYAGLDWENDPASLFDENHRMYGPETGSIAIDNNGMVHCAFSGHCWIHDELGTGYSYYYGLGIDGIFYWNESMDAPLEAPEWVCPDDGTVIPSDPHNVFRMWWPYDGSGEYIIRNFESNNLIGFIDPERYNEMESDLYYHEQDYTQFWQGASALPALCIDESGAIAVGYSSPDTRLSNTNKYLRSIYVTYLEAPYRMADHFGEYTEELGDVFYNQCKLQDADDFMHSYDEAVATISPQNTTNLEFWFGYQADDTPGFNIGNNATQGAASDNFIWATMVQPNLNGLDVEENVASTNTQMEIYPNPAVNQLNVRLENNAEISVYNIMGQNVLNMQGMKGVNTINVNELTSGVYFITAGTVTQKFIVK